MYSHIPFVSWGKPVLNHEFEIFLFLLWGLASCHNMIHPILQRLATPNPRARLRLDRRHGSRKPGEAQIPQDTHSATDPGEMLRLHTFKKIYTLDWHLCKLPIAACAGVQREIKKDSIIEHACNEPLTKERHSHF